MGKIFAAAVACAAVAFVLAFYAAGADKTPKRRTVTYSVAAAFTDPSARAVATAFTGRPDALQLPVVHRVVHHRRHSAPAPTVIIQAPPPASTTATQTHSTPAPTPPSPTRKRHRGGGGTGTGTTIVGP